MIEAKQIFLCFCHKPKLDGLSPECVSGEPWSWIQIVGFLESFNPGTCQERVRLCLPVTWNIFIMRMGCCWGNEAGLHGWFNILLSSFVFILNHACCVKPSKALITKYHSACKVRYEVAHTQSGPHCFDKIKCESQYFKARKLTEVSP